MLGLLLISFVAGGEGLVRSALQLQVVTNYLQDPRVVGYVDPVLELDVTVLLVKWHKLFCDLLLLGLVPGFDFPVDFSPEVTWFVEIFVACVGAVRGDMAPILRVPTLN